MVEASQTGQSKEDKQLINMLLRSRLFRGYETVFTKATGLPLTLRPVEFWLFLCQNCAGSGQIYVSLRCGWAMAMLEQRDNSLARKKARRLLVPKIGSSINWAPRRVLAR